MDVRTEADFPPSAPTPSMKRRRSLEDTEDEDEGVVVDHSYQVRQQRKSNAHQNRQRKAKQTSLTIQVPTASFVRRDSDSTDSLISIPPTPIGSIHEDMLTRCSSISPIAEALDVSSASSSVFATPNLSPLLGESKSLPMYRQPHMRVTRSSSKIRFSPDPELDETIDEDVTTKFSPDEMDHILEGLMDERCQKDDKQRHRLEQEEVDHVVALSLECTSGHQAAPLVEHVEGLYWHQKCAFGGDAVLLGSNRQALAAQIYHDQQEPDNQLGLSIPAPTTAYQPSRIGVSQTDDIANATWSRVVLISPCPTSPSSDTDRAFWKAIKAHKRIRYMGILPYRQEEDPVGNDIDLGPLAESIRSCYLYHSKPASSNRPQQERFGSHIKATLKGLQLQTDAMAADHGPSI